MVAFQSSVPIDVPEIPRGRSLTRKERCSCQIDGNSKATTILTVDVGTSGCKAALYYPANQTLGPVFRHAYQPTYLPGMRVAQDLSQWTDAVINTSKQALLSNPIPPIAVSITGQMQDLIAVGPDTPPLLRSEAILYSDARAFAEAEELSKITGRSISASSLLSKLKLLPKPTGTDNYRFLLGAADFVAYQMTESRVAVSDATTASTTSLTLPPFHREYDEELLETCGLSSFVPHLPRILSRLSRLGKIDRRFAHILNLPEDTEIIHSGGDALSTTLGAGSDYVYAGTSGWVGATRDTGKYCLQLSNGDDERGIMSLGSIANAGDCLRRLCETLGVSVFEIDQIVRHTPIGSNGVVFVPYVTARRCPPSSKPFSGWYGMTTTTTKAELLRAGVEGVVYALASAADGMQLDVSAWRPLVVGGGVARCRTFVHGMCSLLGQGRALIKLELGLLGAGWVGSREMELQQDRILSNWQEVDDDDDDEVRVVEVSAEQVEMWISGWCRWQKVVSSFEKIDDEDD